jgi:hypothetical protein
MLQNNEVHHKVSMKGNSGGGMFISENNAFKNE